MDKLTLAQIDQYRRNAKRVAKRTSQTYTEALDDIAKLHGYKSWALMMKAHNESPA